MLAFKVPAEVHETPFRWALISGMLSEATATTLRNAFPDLKHSIRESGSDKSYSVHSHVLVAPDGSGTLGGPWVDFVNSVTSPDYRNFIQEMGCLDLSGAVIEVALNSYTAGGFMSPHTDRPPKLATHVIYLAPCWQSQWGGHLSILADRESPPVHQIEPAWPRSVLLVRSEGSWHTVERVRSDARLARQTIQVSFWSERPRAAAPGRIVLS